MRAFAKTRKAKGLGALLLACFAVISGALAYDVLTAHQALRAARVAAQAETDASRIRPAFRITENLLGIADDLAFRDAVRRFRVAGKPNATSEERRIAQAKLVGIVRDDRIAAAVRSKASNLLGILLIGEAVAGGENPREFLALAMQSFQNAILFDTDNEEAKRNLELLFVLQRLDILPVPSGGDQADPDPDPGAGSGSPNSGY